MISPTLSRIEMDKYLMIREKCCQTERKKSWDVCPQSLSASCMSLILTVLVLGQDGPGCCQRFGLPNLIFRKNSELVLFSLLCNSRLKIWLFKIGNIFYTFLDRWQWNLCWMWQLAWTRHQRRHRISQWDILEGGHQSPWISPRRVWTHWQ